ncbi:MAG: DNA-binding protein [Candidatus Woesearchaeota archaeon]
MDELDAIKQKKLEELHSQINQSQEEAQAQQQVEQIESIVRQKLTKEAISRYGNIKAAYPEKSMQLLAVLYQLIAAKRIDKVDDETLTMILAEMRDKKEFNMKRK